MNQFQKMIKNIFITVGVLAVFFCLSLVVENVFQTNSLIPAIFALAVFLVSLITDGYVYGIIASLTSVLAVNFAFTFPFFKFNFTIPENLVSAIIMLVITIWSSALTVKVRQQDKMRAETAREKMRANLLRAVSHDLRTPLTTIYGSSSVIMKQYEELSKEQVLQLTKGIQEDSQWLIGMVENLLSVTKIDGGNVNLIKNSTVLEELVDAVLIEQVIVNILENAVQHATGMKNLTLRVFVAKKNAVFEIIDDGCGISKERMSDIFTGILGGEEVKFTQTEYNIVQLLSMHAGRVLTYSEIIKKIWGYADVGSVKKLQVNMANIRKKLGEKPGENQYIINELGVGYRMNAPE